VEPLTRPPEVNDIVLCKVRGFAFLHIVVNARDDAVCIANNRGHVNGWTNIRNVFGVVTRIKS
jgi:hypothetical protein